VTVTRYGAWAERLEAVAVGRELVAVAGRRDAGSVVASSAHMFPIASLDKPTSGWPCDAPAAINALVFAGDALLVFGGDEGVLVACDSSAERKPLANIKLGASVRSIAVDASVARGDGGAIAVGTADGTLHEITFAIANGTPSFSSTNKRKLSDGAINCIARDPAGLWLAGAADGQLWVVGSEQRAVLPGGDGGIRAVVAVGDGRAVLGCGDGSIRMCYIVGDVEPTDRSGDFGHQGSVRGLALGPLIVDDAGRESPRRMFSAGEDGVLKLWFLDGARRPKTIEPNIGPITSMVFAPGPVAKIDKAAGRLWITSTNRKVWTTPIGADLDLAGEPTVFLSVFDAYESTLRDGKAAVKVKMEAVAKLTDYAEDEARVLLDLALASGPPEVRVAATQAMVRSNRRLSRPALRAALSAQQPELRGAAFHALRDLEADQPLSAIRAGLAVGFDDVRVRAVEALMPLAPTSVIAASMIADALRDNHPNVRRRAYSALRQVAKTPLDAVRTALARGMPDVRAQGMLDLGFILRASDAEARSLVAGAFDDADAGVRSSAFMASIAMRPRLAGRLLAVVPSVKAFWDQVTAQFQLTAPHPPDPGALDDEELEPLFAQLACRHADAAIRGAGCLLALGDPRAIGAVLQLTREADPALRRHATGNLVTALVKWPEDDRLAARLVWLLDDADTEVRSFAFDALAKTAAAGGVNAELELANIALRTSQEDIRVRTLQILVRIGAPGASDQAAANQAHALLGDALDDEAPKVRSEAFRTLWAWHTADPLVPLTRGAKSRHADLRTQVVNEIDRRRQGKQSNAQMDALLRGLVGDPVAQVGLAAYAALTKQPDDGTEVAIAPEIHLAAMSSPAIAVRAAGAKGAAKAPAASVRGRLVQLVKDDNPPVHIAAIESLDTVAPNDAEGFVLAWTSLFWELQVRAGELCGARRDPRAIPAMQRILSIPKTDHNRPPDYIRQRAARALADVGDAQTISFQQGLVDDEDGIVREMGARGIATSATIGDEKALGALLGLLGHPDLPVRSWGGEGLAKLGDLRALPVLAGTQKHDHRPLRIGAIVGFVALGPDGVRGLRQGLEDRDREIQDLAFAVIVARDAALAAAGIAPDLLVDAMSSPSPEIRFTAARLVERRAAGEAINADVIGEIIGPRKPEKATDMKDWPAVARRTQILQVLADSIASDQPGLRYAAAQVLGLRTQPLTYWKEAQRLAGPSRGAPAPMTSWSSEARVARRSGWLRRLVGDRRDPEATELETIAKLFVRAGGENVVDASAAQRLVFGVYAGLVRQAPEKGAADETHRVRRDAVGRLLDLARQDAVGVDAVLPVLGHAVGDPHHLVRQAAMAALRSLYPVGALAPLAQAINGAADLGKAAIDELVALAIDGDDRARALVRSALDADDSDTRAYAQMRLPKLFPAGSAEPQLIAAQSKHGDIRLAAIRQLATASDPSPAITDALIAALGSEHADLRLRAAVALARKGNSLGVDVLGGFLRDENNVDEALEALVGLADKPESAAAATDAIAGRIDDDPDRTADRAGLLNALGRLGHANAIPTVTRLIVEIPAGKEGELEFEAKMAFDTLERIVRDRTAKPRTLPDGRTRQRYREELALRAFADAARSPIISVRLEVANALGDVDDRAAELTLEKLLTDRDATVRTGAAEALALRAEYVPSATLAALESALRGGRRELVLPAALGLAARKRAEAFQPLLLVAKAGEGTERDRALLALGSLGDRRALEHLKPLLDPEPDDEASRQLTPAAVEALGRLLPALTGDEAEEIDQRLERIALAGPSNLRVRALTGLRYAGKLGLIERVAADQEASNDVRQHAVAQLGLAAAPSSETVLAELLNDSNWNIRQAAVESLGKVLGGDRTRVSLHALGSTYSEVQRPAATFLASAGDASILVSRLGGIASAEVRQMLREGLIRRGDAVITSARAELDAALRGEDPLPRTEAAWIVGSAAAAQLAEGVTAATARGEAGWREASARNVATRIANETAAWFASLWAARRVRAQGAVAVEASATAAVADDRAPANVRRESAAVLAEAGSASATKTLGNAIGDIDREVRSIAAETVARAAPQTAADLVRGLGSRADASTVAPLALTAWPSLASDMIAKGDTRWIGLAISLSGQRTIELLAIARTKGHEGRLAAIGALGALGGDAVKEALEAIHADTSEEDAVKLAAWKALKRILRREAKVYAEGQDKPKRGEGSGGGSSGDGDGDDDGGGGDDDDGDGGDDDDDDDDDGGDDDDDDDGGGGDDDDDDDDDDSDDDDEDYDDDD
jgi:ParB family chromosome partitioning protein